MCEGCKKAALREAIAEVEASHFRTVHDTGADRNALVILNVFRSKAGMPALFFKDLPAWCEPCKTYHVHDQHTKKAEQEHLDSIIGQ